MDLHVHLLPTLLLLVAFTDLNRFVALNGKQHIS